MGKFQSDVQTATLVQGDNRRPFPMFGIWTWLVWFYQYSWCPCLLASLSSLQKEGAILRSCYALSAGQRHLGNPDSVPESFSYFFLISVLLFSPDELVAPGRGTSGGMVLSGMLCPTKVFPKIKRGDLKNLSFQNSPLVYLNWLRWQPAECDKIGEMLMKLREPSLWFWKGEERPYWLCRRKVNYLI